MPDKDLYKVQFDGLLTDTLENDYYNQRYLITTIILIRLFD
jgi:hypothetical protein